jgi:hypothetical protein
MRAQAEQAGTKALAQEAAARTAALEGAQRASQNRLDDLATRLGAVEDWSGNEEAQNQLLRRCARASRTASPAFPCLPWVARAHTGPTGLLVHTKSLQPGGSTVHVKSTSAVS